jgi:hypothetical protein
MILFIRLLNITLGAEENVDPEVKSVSVRTGLHWSKIQTTSKVVSIKSRDLLRICERSLQQANNTMQRIRAPDFHQISTLSLRKKKDSLMNWDPVQRRLLIIVCNCFGVE